MLKSMTAYGRASLSNHLGNFSAEIKSVNRKHLEVALQLPPELMRFEVNIRRWISSVITRGQIFVKITADFDRAFPLLVKPNLALARHLKNAWDAIAKELDLPPERSFKLSMLAEQEKIMIFQDNLLDEEAFQETLHNVLNMALEKLTEMKKNEGRLLQKDFQLRIDKMQASLDSFALIAPLAEEKYRQKLLKRMAAVLPVNAENESGLLREVALYAERSDISEEIVRLGAHLQQFATLINGPTDNHGKALDFLLQEMLREANTLGAKSSDLEIAQLVIASKSELERMREQIQNIE